MISDLETGRRRLALNGHIDAYSSVAMNWGNDVVVSVIPESMPRTAGFLDEELSAVLDGATIPKDRPVWMIRRGINSNAKALGTTAIDDTPKRKELVRNLVAHFVALPENSEKRTEVLAQFVEMLCRLGDDTIAPVFLFRASMSKDRIVDHHLFWGLSAHPSTISKEVRWQTLERIHRGGNSSLRWHLNALKNLDPERAEGVLVAQVINSTSTADFVESSKALLELVNESPARIHLIRPIVTRIAEFGLLQTGPFETGAPIDRLERKQLAAYIKQADYKEALYCLRLVDRYVGRSEEATAALLEHGLLNDENPLVREMMVRALSRDPVAGGIAAAEVRLNHEQDALVRDHLLNLVGRGPDSTAIIHQLYPLGISGKGEALARLKTQHPRNAERIILQEMLAAKTKFDFIESASILSAYDNPRNYGAIIRRLPDFGMVKGGTFIDDQIEWFDREQFGKFLETANHTDFVFGLRIIERKVGGKDAALAAIVRQRILSDPDPLVREVAARAIMNCFYDGAVDFEIANRALSRQLEVESDPFVRGWLRLALQQAEKWAAINQERRR